jgi:hypothetical protein
MLAVAVELDREIVTQIARDFKSGLHGPPNAEVAAQIDNAGFAGRSGATSGVVG